MVGGTKIHLHLVESNVDHGRRIAFEDWVGIPRRTFPCLHLEILAERELSGAKRTTRSYRLRPPTAGAAQ